MKKHIPNTITLLNLVSGFLAVIMASQGFILQACFLIIAGMVFDFADGFSARLLKAYSGIGKDLDSLADVVTFGAAPGSILYYLLSGHNLPLFLVIILSGILPAASALRLAKFNNDSEQATSFKGIPTPASAFMLISFFIASRYSRYEIFDILINSAWFLGALSLFLSVMMLVKTRMLSLKFKNMAFSGNEDRYVFIITGAVLLLLFRLASLPMIMMAYIIISVLFVIFRRAGTAS